MGSNNFEIFHRQALLQDDQEIRLFFTEAQPSGKKKGTILLIHGFPQTSYQFRHVIGPLSSAGYHIIAPDYRGHGYSSHPLLPVASFSKKELATDIFRLVTQYLGIKDKIHVVGHDIGGMIAHAYVAQYSQHVESIVWGECPLPGTTLFDQLKHSRTHWHFDFHGHNPEIAVALVTGKEKMYLKHFFDRLTQNQSAFTPEVVDFYTMQYAMPDALRCAFFTYSSFGIDADDNKAWRERNGKVTVRNMVLSGDRSWAADGAESMASEMYVEPKVGIVENSGHYLAEENPEAFVREILGFVDV
ncbi:microsomal epoxide hydrolase [Talaromyces proteolyticus]|uniref:Microsomal epoxide hydrolase n=1 Tax=Talaromyces proteolyticus TaxID=1131652 RepID=A0AAD4KRX8_9EURO|nr:microsomal epoxide hydrolase [Talaromyces proteolyticus]KAH8697894.1 microsomal epoxide hydrolase [Talaromyces proteolyticus]